MKAKNSEMEGLIVQANAFYDEMGLHEKVMLFKIF
jgi:hypothetical protein